MRQVWNKENIQEYINNNNQNCEVLNIEKTNGRRFDINLKCAFCGYVFYESLDKIKYVVCKKSSLLCPYCNQNNKNILFFKENEDYLKKFYPMYTLKEVYRKKSRIIYKIKCDKGHVVDIYKEYLPHSTGCKICNGSKKWKLKDAKAEFLRYGLTLLNEHQYKNGYTPVYVKDDLGYIYKVTVNKLLKRGSTFHKIKGNKYAIHNINIWCKNNRPDYECISRKYKSPRDLLLFRYNGDKIKLDKNRCFYTTYSAFVYDKVEHPLFTMSKGELEISKVLEKNHIDYEFQKTFKDLSSKYSKGHLRFDFYLPDYNICIEYNGKQHYEIVDYFGGERGFEIQQERYKNKVDYCKIKNIKLIEIPYWEFDNIEKIIKFQIDEVIKC